MSGEQSVFGNWGRPVLEAIFDGTSQTLPPEATALLYRCRILPLFTPTVGDRIFHQIRQTISDYQGILTFHLRQALRALGESEIRAVPIKGAHSLLWGRPNELQTRDIDLLIDASEEARARDVLSQLGFRQLASVDAKSGTLSEVQVVENAPGYYAYHPWTKLVEFPFAHMAETLAWLKANHLSPFPFMLVLNRPMLAIQIDLHHSVWPCIPLSNLQTVPAATSDISDGLYALDLKDRLVVHGTHALSRMMSSRQIHSLGQLRQLLSSVPAASEQSLFSECTVRAIQLNLESGWQAFTRTIAGLKAYVRDGRLSESIEGSNAAAFSTFWRAKEQEAISRTRA